MKKLLSVLLVIALVFSSMLSLTQLVSADGGSPVVTQVCKQGNSAVSYSGFNWNGLGENLIPDPTVSHFDVGGAYGRYAKFDSNYNPVEVNPYYWWDKYVDCEEGFKKHYQYLSDNNYYDMSTLAVDGNGYRALTPGYAYGKQGNPSYQYIYRSPLNYANAVTKGQYASLTDDGSGVIYYSTGGGWRYMPLPAMKANTYYVIKFKMKYANGYTKLGIRLNPTVDSLLGFDDSNNCGKIGQSANGDTAAFVLYTGANSYTDPCIAVYLNGSIAFYADDFGMYEISADYAQEQSEGVRLTDPPVEETTMTQVCKQGSSAIDYSSFYWDGLGENLIPDPTVSHFDVGGEYGRYAKLDSNYNPVEVNPYYWWDKYVDFEEGFKKHYKYLSDNNYYDMSTLAVDGNGYRALTPGYAYSKQGSPSYQYVYRSPLNFSNAVTKGQYDSLTDDGSGVIRYTSSGDWRYMPLPAMKADTYYVIKFKMKYATAYTKLGIRLNPTVDSLLGFDDSNNCGKIGQSDSGDTAAFVLYTGTNSYTDPCIAVYLSGSIAFYADDFGMYEVSEEYATAQSEGVKLTDPRGYLYGSEYSVSSNMSNNGELLYDYSGVIPSNTYLGENLITDPTVSAFEAGVYAEDGWWNTKVDNYHGNPEQEGSNAADGNLIYASPKLRGLLSDNTADSHTNDGSGAIVLQTGPKTGNTSNRSFLLPLPKIESYSYYLVSMWVNTDANALAEMAFGLNVSTTPLFSQLHMFRSGWKQIVTVVYTGDNTYNKPFIKVMDTKDSVTNAYVNKTIIIDDICMYKINNMNYGAACVESKYVIKDTVDFTDSDFLKQDVNADGIVSESDIRYLRNSQLGSITLFRSVNADTDLNIKDYVNAKQFLVSRG